MEPVDVLHATGYDLYVLNNDSRHPSGAYIVFNALRDSKYSSALALTIERHLDDPQTFFYRYGMHFAYGNKTPQEVAKGLPPHKVLVLYSDDFSPEQLRAIYEEHKCTIIMVMMTHNLLAGGCSYPRTPDLEQGDIRKLACDGYKNSCGNCPELEESQRHPHDKTHEFLERKKENYAGLPIILAGVSSYSLSVAQESSVFKDNRKELLPILHDVPMIMSTKQEIRNMFGIPVDDKVILWGTTNPTNLRKGKALMEEVLNSLWDMMTEEERQKTHLLQVGPVPITEPFHEIQKFHVFYSGYVPSRKQMAAAYKCADVSVCTTVSDAGPMMVTESLSNECPVVGFDRSVISNIVENGISGYIIENLDTEEMAKKTLEILRSPDHQKISHAAKDAALKYHDPTTIKKKWETLIGEIIENASQPI